jgi:hypothetical protein
MPLSDYEQKILEEIEKQFYEQDPKFARGVATGTLHRNLRRNFRRGLALFVLGVFVLLAFFLEPNVLVGVAAFLIMLAGFTVAYQNLKKLGLERAESTAGNTRPVNPMSKLFGSLEQRMRDMRRRRGD